METDAIYREAAAKMTHGVMLHMQLADYYDFLNLHGYKRMHEYHALCEVKGLRRLNRQHMNRYGRLIEREAVADPDAIPSSWYRYKKSDVDVNTKRGAVRTGMERWLSWESDAKEFFEKAAKDLFDNGEVGAATEMKCYAESAAHELKCAERKSIDLASVDYSIEYVLSMQECLHDKYKAAYDKH